MSETFIFLEILDPEINGLLHSIREISTGADPTTNIHITLRGPYYQPISSRLLNNIKRKLLNGALVIANPGIFTNKGEYITYLSVTHPYLQSVSWKRDFPIKDFGFNPHISLYVGSDVNTAEKLFEFLKQEKIELICNEFAVATYVRKSPSLIPENPEIQYFYPRLINSGRIRADLLLRLKKYIQ